MTTRIQPPLVNQFYRLAHTTTGYAVIRRWNVEHFDSRGQMHNWDSEDCTCAVGAMLAFAQSRGEHSYGPGDIRLNQEDFSGGIGLDDVDVAFGRLGLDPLVKSNNAGRLVVKAWLSEGRAVGLGVQYGRIPRSVQAQKGGTFDHALGLVGLYGNSTDLYDPLAKAIVRTNLDLLFPAAEALAQRVRGDHDGSRLFTAATKPLPVSGLTLRFGARKTTKYPDRQRAHAVHGGIVNVHSKPRTGSATVSGILHDGDLYTAYQVTDGDSFDGTTTWYGDGTGTRWVSAARLTHIGGTT